MDSRRSTPRGEIHTLVSITAAPDTRLVCFHLHKPTPGRPFGKHATLTSASGFSASASSAFAAD